MTIEWSLKFKVQQVNEWRRKSVVSARTRSTWEVAWGKLWLVGFPGVQGVNLTLATGKTHKARSFTQSYLTAHRM